MWLKWFSTFVYFLLLKGESLWLQLNLIYKDECLFLCLFVCMYVCMYGTYTNSHFWTDLNQTLHTSLLWSGRYRRVCMDSNSRPLRPFGPFFFGRPLQNHGHKTAAGATVFRDTLISVIPAGVRVTSPTWRRRRRSHPRQPYIRDSTGSFSNVAEMTS